MVREVLRWVPLLAGIVLGGAPAPAEADAPAPVKLACIQRHEEAQVSRKQGRLLATRSALLACSRADCPDAIRADCVDWLDDVNRSIPSVVVTARDRGADVTDVRVFVDGELTATHLTGGALEADPGEHHFRFESPHGPPLERTLLLAEGVRNRLIEVELAPPPPPPAPRPAPVPWSLANHPLQRSDYMFAGLAVAGLATAAAFGAWAIHERHTLDQSCAPFCADADLQPVRAKLVAGDVALGAALVALAVGSARYLSRPAVRRGVEVSAGAWPTGGASVILWRRF